jgi:hypothetical protein
MYVYFGHHRCATLWTNSVILAVCRELGLRFDHSAEYGKMPDGFHEADFFAHINADMRVVKQLDGVDYRAFHVIRDPRDILISSYFSDRYSHPVYSDEFARFRVVLNSVDFDEGLGLELDRREAEFTGIAGWDYANPRVYETCFEDLTTHPYDEFLKAFRFLGLSIPDAGSASLVALFKLASTKVLRRIDVHVRANGLPPQWLRVILRRNSFQRRAKRRKGQEDQQHHYRKGVSGDWSSYLTGENKTLFKERWGQLLIDLGYETDLDW